MGDYVLMKEPHGTCQNHSWWRITALVLLYVLTMLLVFMTWKAVYDDSLQFSETKNEVPELWIHRAKYYANSVQVAAELAHDFRLVKNQTARLKSRPTDLGTESNPGESRRRQSVEIPRLVCYYTTPTPNKSSNDLRLSDVTPELCTHINIGVADVQNCSLALTDDLLHVLRIEVPVLRLKNTALKVMLWVGGGGSGSGFVGMVKNHNNRKLFIQSVKSVLRQYSLDGIDLDWEFPSAYNKERQHFSQLLYEIRQEYRREKRDYLLSIAVAAPEGIATFAYDVGEINKYADFANLMTYDFHFYTRGTPFTGLNAPLYAHINERSIMGTLNINYSVNWWLANGLDREKLVVGLPTYGHSFTLVNPFNNAIGAPAAGYGGCGDQGFTTYFELCWFKKHNLVNSVSYDKRTCSPYLSSGTEWISYENEKSMECKARYVKEANLGGVMAFSLNTDDHKNLCETQGISGEKDKEFNTAFPLIEAVKLVLNEERVKQ